MLNRLLFVGSGEPQSVLASVQLFTMDVSPEVSAGVLSRFIEDFKRIAISHGDWSDFDEIEDGLNLIMSLVCVSLAALASGLTMGLLSLDQSKLEIKAMVGSPAEKLAAIRLLPIVKQHHLLLVTLLLTNSIASESLPIFLGEIVPNIYGPDQLVIAGHFHGVVIWMMWLLYPLTYPIGLLLDWMFQHEAEDGAVVTHAEMEAVIDMKAGEILPAHYGGTDARESTPRLPPSPGTGANANDPLSQAEVEVVSGLLQLAGAPLGAVLIPNSMVYCLAASTRLDRRTQLAIARTGFSRIPVYFEHSRRFVGYILTRSLLEADPALAPAVATLPLRQPLIVPPDMSLLGLLDLFKRGRCHLAFVSRNPDATRTYLQHKLRVEAYLDQQQHEHQQGSGWSRPYASTDAADGGETDSATRSRATSVLAPPGLGLELEESDEEVDGGSGLPAVDLELARKLGLESLQRISLSSRAGRRAAASALAELEVVGIVTLQDVLQEVFRGNEKHDSMQSGNKYTRLHTPVRGLTRAGTTSSLTRHMEQDAVETDRLLPR